MTSPSENFVHLHVHSDFSKLDGCATVEQYVDAAVARGHQAVSITDHGSMRGFFDLHKHADKAGIKPIFGVEFYVCKDMKVRGLDEMEKEAITKGLGTKEKKSRILEEERRRGIRGNWHLTAWAMNNEGLRNLFKLTTMSWTDGFYYRPRIDLATLLEHQAGIIVGTACVSGLLPTLGREGRKAEMFEALDALHETFGERLFFEVMPHDMDIQHEGNKLTLGLATKVKGRLLATQDAHYIDQDGAEHQDVLLCIGTAASIHDPDRFRFPGDMFWFKTREQMEDGFADQRVLGGPTVKAAMDNTIRLVEMVDTKLKVDPLACLLPPVEVPAGLNQDEYLQDLCLHGWEWRNIPKRAGDLATMKGMAYDQAHQVYIDRLKRELGAISRQKFVPYFLIVHDVYQWVRSKGIMCGPGRGSAAGSLVSYLLGITTVDPLEHDLLFERFINPGRVTMPDIDCDFEDARRDEVFDYVEKKYGQENCSRISTVGRLSSKQVVKDVGRTLDVPYQQTNQLTACMKEELTLEENFEQVPECKDFKSKYPRVLHHAEYLEGMAKLLGTHPAGFVVSPVPLVDLLPLETRAHKGGGRVKVTGVDMKAVESLGLLKLDFLGLRTMSAIRKCVQAVKEQKGIDIDLEHLALNDPEILAGFTGHDFTGVFQFDTHAMSRTASGVKFERFEDIAIMNALNRPGTAKSGLAQEYLARKEDPALVEEISFHQKVTDLTQDTLGVIVYQEHVVKIMSEVAGFTPQAADGVRKAIGKKEPDELKAIREDFITGACNHTPDMTIEVATKLFDAIEEWGGYGFNKSHAVAYGILAFWCMYLKKNFPLQFYWALVDCEPDRDKIRSIVRKVLPKGIKFLPPDVSRSKVGFTIDVDQQAIRGSLQDIMYVGDAAAEAVMNGQPYTDLVDFLERTERRKVTKRTVTSLTKSGALDDLVPNSRWLVERLELVWELVKKKKWPDLKMLLSKSGAHQTWDEQERAQVAAEVNPLAFGVDPLELYADFMAKHIKVKIQDLSDPDFYGSHDRRWVFILGTVLEVRRGYFEARTEADGKRFGWTKNYTNLYLQDAEGGRHRMQLDWNVSAEFDDLAVRAEKGENILILARARASRRYMSFRAAYVVSIQDLDRKVKDGAEMSVWDAIVTGNHPTVIHPWKRKSSRRAAMENMEERSDVSKGHVFSVTGVVCNIKKKMDKRNNEMAHFDIDAVTGHVEATCFGSAWPDFKSGIKTGNLVTVRLEKGKDLNLLDLDYGKVWVHKS